MRKVKLPFGWELYIFICKKEELNILARKLKLEFKFDPEDHKTNGFSEFIKQESPKKDLFVIWVNSEAEGTEYLLLHEIIHTVYEYLLHLGIRDNEFEAYLFEDICRKLKLFG